jgi:SAM-dependent methyltransferase
MIGKKHEYLLMAKAEATHWWFRTLHRRVVKQIGKSLHSNWTEINLLDAGCGTGGLILYLQRQGIQSIWALDASADAAAITEAQTGVPVILAPLQEVSLHFPAAAFDVVCCMDVMTYLQDAEIVEVLEQFAKLLKPGGIIVLNNNAFRAFRGTHDIQLGIGKRFVKKDFVKYAAMASVCILENNYWNFILSPMVWLIRKCKLMLVYFSLVAPEKVASDLSLPPSWVNGALFQLLKWETRLIKQAPWGTSLFSVLRVVPSSKK